MIAKTQKLHTQTTHHCIFLAPRTIASIVIIMTANDKQLSWITSRSLDDPEASKVATGSTSQSRTRFQSANSLNAKPLPFTH